MLLAQELQPNFGVLDLVNLPNRDFYLKLMIDGAPSVPFSATSLAPNERVHRRLGNSESNSYRRD